MTVVRGVIFDIDGTLVDSNDDHARSWVEAAAESGIEVEYEKVRRHIGMGGDKLLPAVFGITKDSPQGQKLSERSQPIFKSRSLERVQPFEGAADLVRQVRDRGMKVICATSGEAQQADRLLEIAGVREMVDVKTSSADAGQSKPAPDIVQVALSKAGLAPTEAVMIGDTPFDMEAAGRAGVRAIGFRSGGWKDKDLTDAAAVYDGPADLLAKFDSSPLARPH